MEVSHDEICIVEDHVGTGVRQGNPGDAADDKQENKTEGIKHRHFELDRATPHGRQPAKDFHPRGHGNDHRRGRKVSPRIGGEADGEHVVRPDDEANNADGRHGIGHAEVTEHWLFRERRDHLRDDAEGRNNMMYTSG